MISARVQTALLAGILLAGGVLLFARLDLHVLWTDEAHTALFGRNLLNFGTLTAWDGTNLVGYWHASELNAELEDEAHAPLQFYVAAGGMALFGETAFGARVLFAGFGLGCVGAVALWSRRFLGESFPWVLPAALLALSPAFLLYAANSRYYAPGTFFTLLLFALWTPLADAEAPGPDGAGIRLRFFGDRRMILQTCLALLCFLFLFQTHYLNAAASLAVLPVFFLEKQFRTIVLATRTLLIYAVAALCGLYALTRSVGTGILLDLRDGHDPWLTDRAVLVWGQIRDSGYFEFLAWPMLLPLALPWIVPSLRSQRALARKGFLLAAAVLAYFTVVSVLSPQTISFQGMDTDIRYDVPVIAIGAMIAALGLRVLWKLSRTLSIITALGLVGTNALFLGSHRSQMRDSANSWMVRSTLYDYVHELLVPYQNSNDKIIAWCRGLTSGTRILVHPNPQAYSPMFYRPDLKFCNQLPPEKDVIPELRVLIPNYVLGTWTRPDVVLFSPHGSIPGHHKAGMRRDGYRLADELQVPWTDWGRPEIPYRPFYGIPESTPIRIFVPGDAPPSP